MHIRTGQPLTVTPRPSDPGNGGPGVGGPDDGGNIGNGGTVGNIGGKPVGSVGGTDPSGPPSLGTGDVDGTLQRGKAFHDIFG